uniref:Uncharacterized protein n=1 Tax=Ananas comosus var. bracteatus TaxID=296719 RepID=A0A6V7QU01_ANACO
MGVEVVCRWPVQAAPVRPAGAVRSGREIGRRRWIGGRSCAVRCSSGAVLRTCKNCKAQFDPALNHPSACRFHTAHFGGETKRKFEKRVQGRHDEHSRLGPSIPILALLRLRRPIRPRLHCCAALFLR